MRRGSDVAPSGLGILVAAFLTACGGGGDSTDGPVGSGDPPQNDPSPASVDFSPPPMPNERDLSSLPTSVDGNPVILSSDSMVMELDFGLRDPVTTYGMCVSWLTRCFDPATRSMAACVASVPTCASDSPWEDLEQCCPQSCVTQYQAAVSTGQLDEVDAAAQVFLDDGSCFPGLIDATGVAP